MHHAAPPLSVLMAAYNEEKSLAAALDSVCGQSFGDFEFLVVNDGSTDSTLDILHDYAQRDSRLTIINNTRNLRLPASLNVGLEQVRAPLLARMDADDIALPDRFAKQMAFLQAHPEVDVCGTAYQVPETGAIWTNALDSEHIRVRTLFCCEIVHPSVIMKKETLLRFGAYPLVRLCEDYVLWAKMCLNRKVVFANLPDVLMRYSWANYLRHDTEYARLTREMTDEVQTALLREGLGLQVSEAEFFAHKILCGLVPPETLTEDQRELVLTWKRKLQVANARTGLYEPRVLQEEMDLRFPLPAAIPAESPCPRIAVLSICTGKYSMFWDEFFRSCEEHFFPGCEKHYFVFTDQNIEHTDNPRVHRMEQKALGWPNISLYRFKIFAQIAEELTQFDLIFFFHANMVFLQDMGTEILPENKDALVAVLHPDFFDKPKEAYPYERRPESRACVVPGAEGIYAGNALYGGYSDTCVSMLKELIQDTDDDLAKGIVTPRHDEAYLNRYVLDHPCTFLHPGYLSPEGRKLPFPAMLLLLEKNSYGGRSFLRGHTSEPNLPVIASLHGNLGSQMFQLAAALAVAHRFRGNTALDLSWFTTQDSDASSMEHMEDAFPSVRALPRATAEIMAKVPVVNYTGRSYTPEFEKLAQPLRLNGYWQSPRFFRSIEDSIRRVFTFAEFSSPEALTLAEAIRNTPQAVAVLIRHEDYLTDNICGKHYYDNALQEMSERVKDPYLFVFSDDPAWIQEHFDPRNLSWTSVECTASGPSWDGMHLMTLCRHHIVANTGFSWWGAWLARPGGVILVPDRWFPAGADDTDEQDESDIYAEGWIRVKTGHTPAGGKKRSFAMSVVMPTYNRKESLGLAIESILAQSHGDFELIVVDDASTDDTPAILARYAAWDSRVRVIRNKKNLNIARTRNVGVNAAKYDWIAFLDDDDIALTNRLETQAAFLRQHPEVDVCGSAVFYWGPDIVLRYPGDNESIRACTLLRCSLINPSVVVRKRCIEEVGGYSQVYPRGQDYALWLEFCLRRNVVFANLPQSLLCYNAIRGAAVERTVYIESLIRTMQADTLERGFGFRPTEAEMDCHTLLRQLGFIGMQDYWKNLDQNQRVPVIQWCRKLLEYNSRTKLIEETCFRNTLEYTFPPLAE